MYLYVPLLAVYHGTQGFYKDKFKGVDRFTTIDYDRDILFFKLFEQF